jgi:hypothetical protein
MNHAAAEQFDQPLLCTAGSSPSQNGQLLLPRLSSVKRKKLGLNRVRTFSPKTSWRKNQHSLEVSEGDIRIDSKPQAGGTWAEWS